MQYSIEKPGWIEVVCGPMFAGKTEELIRRVKRMDFAKRNILYLSLSLMTDTLYLR